MLMIVLDFFFSWKAKRTMSDPKQNHDEAIFCYKIKYIDIVNNKF